MPLIQGNFYIKKSGAEKYDDEEREWNMTVIIITGRKRLKKEWNENFYDKNLEGKTK